MPSDFEHNASLDYPVNIQTRRISRRFALAAALIVCAARPAFPQEAVHSHAADAQIGHPRYSCPMHPEVVREEPGTCPKCGMTLVAMRTERHSGHEAAASHREHRPILHEMHPMPHAMMSSINLAEPMSRESSGTAWVPDSTPTYGHMMHFGGDMLMLHGAAWPRYVNASTRRGDDRIDMPNWIMAMYSHPFSDNAQLGLRGMMSLDLLTEGGRGYPLLFQTGETWQGKALHDRQHPHDLFAELSASYSQKLSEDFSAFLYVGYPGEPALGPPTFMHRLSAMDNPDAPISHHWQDSTHITFGVATLGIAWKNVKAEGSIFTGREPDETRWDFDRPRFDSYSGRLSWNPTPDLAFQVSHGYVKSPEALEPDAKLHRTTASVIYNRQVGADANWSNSFVWGQNDTGGEGRTQSFLLESNLQCGRDTVYGRYEYVQKSAHELVIPGDAPRAVHHAYGINAFTIGYVHDLTHAREVDVGIGGQFTIYSMPAGLDRYYGDDVPYALQVFLRIRPSRMSYGHAEHDSMRE